MSKDIKQRKVCGIVMPIAGMDDCPETHWAEVKQIIVNVVEGLDYDCKLVSEETDVGVIHKRIVQNLYENDLIICDVSCRNANVMFELGMRLAFDKPVILIKDDKTPYSFDTSPVEHLSYRRDLRFGSINEFKSKLALKIAAVMEGGNTSSFLSSFGTFKTADLKQESVEPYEFLLEEIQALRKIVTQDRMTAPIQNVQNKLSIARAELFIHSLEVSPSSRIITLKCSGPIGPMKLFISSLATMNGVAGVNRNVSQRNEHTLVLGLEDNVNEIYYANWLANILNPDKLIGFEKFKEL